MGTLSATVNPILVHCLLGTISALEKLASHMWENVGGGGNQSAKDDVNMKTAKEHIALEPGLTCFYLASTSILVSHADDRVQYCCIRGYIYLLTRRVSACLQAIQYAGYFVIVTVTPEICSMRLEICTQMS